MPGTTVIWKFEPTRTDEEINEKKTQRQAEAEKLSGADYREQHSATLNEEEGTLTVHRNWPDMAAAEAWVEFVLKEGALFATTTEYE